MANPRKKVEFEGIAGEYVTVKYGSTITYDAAQAAGSAAVGKAATLSGNSQMDLTADASSVDGKVIKVASDGFMTVQVDGFCGLPGGTSATLTPGTKIVGALNSAARGYIRSQAAATLAEVAVSHGRIYDSSDATNVIVDLC